MRTIKDALDAIDNIAPGELRMNFGGTIGKFAVVRRTGSVERQLFCGNLEDATIFAAALIESYGRRVPRAMLEEILNEAWTCLIDRPEGNALQKIAAKHGVKVEDKE